MIRPLLLVTGAALGAGLVRERKMRRRAERFSAAALESLLLAIDANDPDTGAHVRRVAGYSLTIAEALGVDERTRRTIELTALFHDVGKIHEALFDIVHDPDQLTPKERRAIHRHPILGAEVLTPIASFHPRLAEAVLSHHERWDGKGYPRGLRAERIPLPARVVAIADTFDVVTYGRAYRNGRTAEKAGEILAEGRETQFDPFLIDLVLLPPVFERLMRSQRTNSKHGIPKRRLRTGRVESSAPKVKVRWRTRTAPPSPVREEIAAAR